MADRSFESVWDALEKTPEAAAAMKMRSSLLIAIVQKVESWAVTKLWRRTGSGSRSKPRIDSC